MWGVKDHFFVEGALNPCSGGQGGRARGIEWKSTGDCEWGMCLQNFPFFLHKKVQQRLPKKISAQDVR